MKLHQLQALIASANTGSIRAAAKTLGVSQAAVTKALRELEYDQGLSLLNRSPLGLTFTPAGTVLLAHARRVNEQLEQADRDMQHMREQGPQVIRAAFTPWIMLTILPEATFKYRRQSPETLLSLSETLMENALMQLRDGTIDFAVIPLPDINMRQEFHCETWLEYDTTVLVKKGSSLSETTSIHQLLDHPWALNFSPKGYEGLVKEIFACHGVTIAHQNIIQANSFGMIQSLVENGGMCSWSPAMLSQLPQFSSRLTSLTLRETFPPVLLGLVKRRHTVLSCSARCFVDHLLQVLRQQTRCGSNPTRQIFDTMRMLA